MGSLKTRLAAVAAIVATPHAFAADMLMPPPPGPAPVLAELGTGWYLRGDVGYAEYAKVKEEIGFSAGRPFDLIDLESTWSVGAGFGYQFTNWLRADVTVDYRDEARFRALSSRTGYVEGFSTDRAKFESTTFFLNGYIDLGSWYGFTPYVGAGIGLAQNRLANYVTQVTCLMPSCGDPTPGASYPLGPQAENVMRARTNYNLAWALMAGAAVDLGAGFKLDLGYRYVRLGDVRTELDPWGVGTKLKALDAHEARVGFRYMLD